VYYCVNKHNPEEKIKLNLWGVNNDY
jgi:hypothetical protein